MSCPINWRIFGTTIAFVSGIKHEINRLLGDNNLLPLRWLGQLCRSNSDEEGWVSESPRLKDCSFQNTGYILNGVGCVEAIFLPIAQTAEVYTRPGGLSTSSTSGAFQLGRITSLKSMAGYR